MIYKVPLISTPNILYSLMLLFSADIFFCFGLILRRDESELLSWSESLLFPFLIQFLGCKMDYYNNYLNKKIKSVYIHNYTFFCWFGWEFPSVVAKLLNIYGPKLDFYHVFMVVSLFLFLHYIHFDLVWGLNWFWIFLL